jgi:hypothetical protein
MNFTDSPFERMMKQVPGQAGGLCVNRRSAPLPGLRVLERRSLCGYLLRALLLSRREATSGQLGPK